MTRCLTRRRTLQAGLAAATSLALPRARAQQEIVLRIGAGHPTPALAYVFIADTFFVPEVVRRAKDKGLNVRFVKAWAGTVAKLDGIVEAVQKGALDIGLAVPSFDQSRTALLNYGLYFPFTTTDPLLQARVAMRMLHEVPALQDSMKPYGVQVLSMSVTENYGMMLRKEVTGIDGLKGLKLACAGANAPWAQAVGAVPVQMPIGENYQAIQTGLIDGNIYFASGFAAFRLYEVAKYFLKTDFGSFVSNAVFINAERRAALPRELVAILDEVAAESSAKIAEVCAKRDADAVAANQERVRFIALPAADKRRWAESMRDLPARAARELDAKGLKGTETFRAYVRALRDAGHQFPFDYPV
ncbi:MAG: TRAP transporter substrate-binding protein DctP [Burkholderiales bacterium]|nr:TRAP transporter substrate-binding protein DctP [Burkholderiales bacterium]